MGTSISQIAQKRADSWLDHDGRIQSREAIRLPAVITTRFGLITAIEVVNLSETGFRAQLAVRLQRGARIKVQLPNIGLKPAVVVWQLDVEIGCRFRERLTDVDFAALGIVG